MACGFPKWKVSKVSKVSPVMVESMFFDDKVTTSQMVLTEQSTRCPQAIVCEYHPLIAEYSTTDLVLDRV